MAVFGNCTIECYGGIDHVPSYGRLLQLGLIKRKKQSEKETEARRWRGSLKSMPKEKAGPNT